DDVGVQGVGGDVAVLLHRHRVPVAEGDRPVVAPARDAHRPALLLASAHAVRERVVGADVVELGGRLVVPGAPARSAVDGDDDALVGGDQDDLGVEGVDPGRVVGGAAGGAAEGGEGRPAVGGPPGHDGAREDRVRVGRVDLHLGEIGPALRVAGVGVDPPPALARVVGAVEAAVPL